MYARYLAQRLPLYLILGILCSALAGVNVTLIKYNRSLKEMTGKIATLDTKKIQMKRDRDEVAARVRALQALRPDRFWGVPGDEFVLKAVDEIRGNMQGDLLTVTSMNRERSELSLPMELSFNFDTYRQVLLRLHDLEKMNIPFFQFLSFSFQKEQPDRALCRIRGKIVMPDTGEKR